jgi:hypothetical protein
MKKPKKMNIKIMMDQDKNKKTKKIKKLKTKIKIYFLDILNLIYNQQKHLQK